MTREKWEEVWQSCKEAWDLPETERPSYVRAKGLDPEAQGQVLTLIGDKGDSEPPSWHTPFSSKITLQVWPGLQVGRFRLDHPLGQGATGEVWAAYDSELCRRVALKFAVSTGHTIREAQAASLLNHPGIVTVHEVIQVDSSVAIVMELVDGAALRSICATPQPAADVLRYGIQIARALQAAHTGGIIHRDIKPENIMLRPDGYVKLLDFGLARDADEESQTPGNVNLTGTLRYMSPEQVLGNPLTSATDIFSLGIVVAELLMGRHPFASPNSLATAYSIAATEPSIHPGSLPKTIEPLIRAMLAKSPKARPSAAELAAWMEEAFGQSQRPSGLKMWGFSVGAVLALAAAFTVSLVREPVPPVIRGAVQLTAEPGDEEWPDVSPDGESVVYVWAVSKALPASKILVKNLHRDSPSLLVQALQQERLNKPVWSPNGREILYKSMLAGNAAYWVIGADGSGRHKLLDVKFGDLSTGARWSPDAKSIAFSELTPNRTVAIEVYDLVTHTRRTVSNPPNGFWGDWDPAFSPNGRSIAFKRVHKPGQDALCLVPSQGGETKQITQVWQGIAGHAWSPDSRHVIVSGQMSRTAFGLWWVPIGRGKSRPLLANGADALMPSISPHTGRVAWVNELNNENIYRVPFTGGSPSLAVASTSLDRWAAPAKEGHFAFVSRRSGSDEIWIAGANESAPTRITNFQQGPISNLFWSPDGRQLVFNLENDGHTLIYSLQCDAVTSRCGNPSPLGNATIDRRSEGWSSDGGSIYYVARTGISQSIFKVPSSGLDTPVMVVTGTFGPGRASADGKWFYFYRANPSSICRIPLLKDGGPAQARPQQVVGPPYLLSHIEWNAAGDEIVFWDGGTSMGSPAVRAWNAKTQRVRTIVETFSALNPAVSPDGRWLYFGRSDRPGPNVFVGSLSGLGGEKGGYE